MGKQERGGSGSPEPGGEKRPRIRDSLDWPPGPSGPVLPGPSSGLWFHRLGPNPENRLPLEGSGHKPTTTRLDLSKLGQGGSSEEMDVPPAIAQHVATGANQQLLAEMSGATVEWDGRQGPLVLHGSATQVLAAKRLLVRVVTHCQWGANEEKVQRLLNPKQMETAVIRLSPMGISLKAVQKSLSLRHPTLSIGKDKANDAMVADAQISRQHCLMELDSKRGAVYIVDLSTNGTFLNGKRLPNKKHGKVMLSHGDELLLKDPGQDSEFGYMVNLVEASGSHSSLPEPTEETGSSVGREFADVLRRRRTGGQGKGVG